MSKLYTVYSSLIFKVILIIHFVMGLAPYLEGPRGSYPGNSKLGLSRGMGAVLASQH